MNELVRGYIEETIDEIIEKEAIFTNIEWIRQEMPIASFRDLALGYIIGGDSVNGCLNDLYRRKASYFR